MPSQGKKTHTGVQLSCPDVRSGFTTAVCVWLCMCVTAPKLAWGSPQRIERGVVFPNIRFGHVCASEEGYTHVLKRAERGTTTFYISSVPFRKNPIKGWRCQALWSNNIAEGHWSKCIVAEGHWWWMRKGKKKSFSTHYLNLACDQTKTKSYFCF